MNFSEIEDFLLKVFGDGFTEGDITLENQDSGAAITSRDIDLLLDFVHINDGRTILVYLKTSLGEVVGRIVNGDQETTFQLVNENEVLGIELYDKVQINHSNDATIPLPGASRWSLKKLTNTANKLHLSRPVSISVAAAHTSDVWKKVDLTIEELIGELLDHKEGNKEGTCLLQGHMFEAAKATRKAAAMLENHILCLDLDNGTTFKEIDDKMGKLGLAYVRYTTHSHNGTTTDVSKKQFAKFFGEETEVTLQKLREWLQAEKGFKSEISSSASSFKFIQKMDGDFYQVTHDPISKNRVILFLDKPFALRGEEAVAYATEKWKERYLGFAEASGLAYDRACTDAARLFYFPRHPKGRTDFEAKFFDGDALDLFKFSTVKPATLRSKLRKAKHSPINVDTSSPITAALSFTGSPSESSMGKLIQFNKTHSFEIVDALRDYAPEMVLDDKAKGGKGSHITCPNEDMHSKSGGSGTYAVNASSSESGEFELFCTHAHCFELGKIGLLKLIFDNETLPLEILEDENYSQSLILDEKEIEANEKISGKDGKTLKKEKKEREKKEAIEKAGSVIDDVNVDFASVIEGKVQNYIQFLPKSIIEKGYIIINKDAATSEIDRKYKVKSGDTSVRVSQMWLDSSFRRHYSGIVFDPKCENDNKLFNTFTGFSKIPSKKGTWEKLKAHILDTMCLGNERHFNILVTWIAHMIQKPWEKPGFALVMSGGKGTGKTFFAEVLMELVSPYSMLHSKSSAISGNFNSHFDRNILTFLDEGFFAADSDFDSTLKVLITGMKMSVERKGVDIAESKNFSRVILASNSEYVVKASSSVERRYFCFSFPDVVDREAQSLKFKDLYEEVYKNGGLEAFKYDLENWIPPFEESWNILIEAPVTAALREQQVAASNLKERFFIDLLTYGQIDTSDAHETIYLNEDRPNKIIYNVFKNHLKKYIGNKAAQYLPEYEIRKLLTKYLDASYERDSVNTYILTPPLKSLRDKFNANNQFEIANEIIPTSVTLGRPTLVKLNSSS